ncbi:MAG: DUF4293 domain-containing protein [Thermoflavifilum sp.]|nr:DUF4293 domain-containing protein [Thermoflavifilum sp.]
MIQRIQTLYLLLAACCGVLTWIIPFGKVEWLQQPLTTYVANDSFWLTLLMILAILLAIIAIFLFKNRPLQFRLTIFGLLASLAALILEYRMIHLHQQETTLVQRAYYWIGIALPVMMMLFFLLAARSIRKDEKLVRSVDRLR